MLLYKEKLNNLFIICCTIPLFYTPLAPCPINLSNLVVPTTMRLDFVIFYRA